MHTVFCSDSTWSKDKLLLGWRSRLDVKENMATRHKSSLSGHQSFNFISIANDPFSFLKFISTMMSEV